MKGKPILVISAVAIVAVVSIALLAVALGWRFYLNAFWQEWKLGETASYFRQNEERYQQLFEWARTQSDDRPIDPPRDLADLATQHFRHRSNPMTVEMSPVSFYYVIVYTDRDVDVLNSPAYLDEGAVIKRLGKRWVIVRRGWM